MQQHSQRWYDEQSQRSHGHGVSCISNGTLPDGWNWSAIKKLNWFKCYALKICSIPTAEKMKSVKPVVGISENRKFLSIMFNCNCPAMQQQHRETEKGLKPRTRMRHPWGGGQGSNLNNFSRIIKWNLFSNKTQNVAVESVLYWLHSIQGDLSSNSRMGQWILRVCNHALTFFDSKQDWQFFNLLLSSCIIMDQEYLIMAPYNMPTPDAGAKPL